MADPAASWYAWLNELRLVPQEYQYIISVISGFFITLAMIPIAPILLLVIYDIILWFWRLAGANWRLGRARRTRAANTEPTRPPMITPPPGESLGSTETNEQRHNIMPEQ
ncbi:uncharacterized protein P884DRAFT_68240 [Thermothelomyces heterothallicus CBS 202.75]|uniref:uncharacterized protein n=1 Tax=Thermothelomyces heterothallicus CBS 202.75 TaxID=1149848 RepID=UPI00374260D6